jgi:acetyltransferase-like isoleucine patch superfamily enzyme
MTEEHQALFAAIRQLHQQLRADTRAKYQRMNPSAENLADWKERGAYWVGQDRDVTIYESATLIGDVQIGERCWIGPFCLLDGSGGLTIGKYCSISTGAQLLTHDTVRWALSGGTAPYERSPTHIGDCCFIGTHAVVLRGVTIGSHCLVGAQAVVNRDVPDNTIVAGVPARAIGKVVVDGSRVELIYE